MPSFDMIIKNGRVVNSERTFQADVMLDEGRIADVRKRRPSDHASSVIDARGKLVIPGSIDSHVHFREPGLTQKEDFQSGSRGAAAGGVTTVLDMPTTLPIVTNKELFLQKAALVGGKAHVDFGLYAAAGGSNTGELRDLRDAGAVAFKTYMVAPPPERVKEYEGSFISDSGQLLKVAESLARIGALHCIHAEDDSTIKYLTDKLLKAGRRDSMAHYDSRPNFTEELAVASAAAISEAVGSRSHILHTSTKEALRVIRDAKLRKVKLTCETCPHYIYFTKDALRKFGPFAKFNPPPRRPEDVEAVWRGIRDGTVDVVASDHAPHTKAEKERGSDDVWLAPPGTPGVETRLPFLFTFGPRHGLGYTDLVRVACTSPAKVYRVDHRKGSLRRGLDADIAIIDHKKEWKLRKEDLQSKSADTVIFEGMTFVGRVVQTLVRGVSAYEEGVGSGKPGMGVFLRPK